MMLKERTIEDHIKSAKREYRKVLIDLNLLIQQEFSAIGEDDFIPSTAIDSNAFQSIQHANRLRSLMGVDHG